MLFAIQYCFIVKFSKAISSIIKGRGSLLVAETEWNN